MPSGGRRVMLGDVCKDCGRTITRTTAVYKGFNEYLQNKCKPCYIKHRDSVPSRSKEARAKNFLEWKWGIKQDEYDKKLALQLGGCAICKAPANGERRLAIDHDHKTGQLRDLLCTRCNAVLGLVNDDENWLLDVLEYLKRHSLKTSA